MDVKVQQSFEVCFKALKFYNLWIDGQETPGYRARFVFYVIFGPITFWSMLIIGISRSELSLDLAHPITFQIASTVVIMRIFHFIANVGSIKRLYETIQQIMENNVKNVEFIRKRMKFYAGIFIFSIANAYIAVIAGFPISFISHQYPYPIAVPFNIDSTEIGFYGVNIYISIVIIYIAPVFVILGWYPMFFMNFAIGLMEDFNERLAYFAKSTVDVKNDDEREKIILKEIIDIIETYEKIKTFVKEFTRIFKISFFAIGVAGSVILCTVLFVIPLVSL